LRLSKLYLFANVRSICSSRHRAAQFVTNFCNEAHASQTSDRVSPLTRFRLERLLRANITREYEAREHKKSWGDPSGSNISAQLALPVI
jgi:hypothetical protein